MAKGTISGELIDVTLDQTGQRKLRMKLVGGEGEDIQTMTFISPVGFVEMCEAAGVVLKDGQKYTLTISESK